MDLHVVARTLLSAFLLLDFQVSQVSTCQCSRHTHPQQYMCEADYVIRGKVLSEDFVRIGDTKTPKTEAPTLPPAPTTKRSPFKFPKWSEPQWWQPLLRPPSPRDRQHPQWHNPFLGIHHLPPLVLADQPPPPSPRQRRPLVAELRLPVKEEFPWQYRRRYRVKVDKVYKGEERIAARSIIDVYTESNEGMCGKELSTDTRYLIAGYFVEGEIFIDLCDWVVEKSKLTKDQRRGLRHTYKKYCDVCRIKSGTLYWPPEAKEKDVCPYNPYLMDNTDCEGRFSSCIRYPDGTCNWMQTKGLKNCKRKSETVFL